MNMNATQTTETMKLIINGASDDIIQVSGTISDEFYLSSEGSGVVRIIAPNGDFLDVLASYGLHGAEWLIRVESAHASTPSWPMRFVPRPGDDLDPGIEITVPVGSKIEGPR